MILSAGARPRLSVTAQRPGISDARRGFPSSVSLIRCVGKKSLTANWVPLDFNSCGLQGMGRGLFSKCHLFDHFQFALIHRSNIPGAHAIQHQTLLPSPVTTTGCCFCFGSIPSFFLELFLRSSPVAFWAPTNLGSLSFSVLSFAFSYCSWGSQGKNTEVVSIPFSSGPRFVRTLHHDPSILGGPTQHGL